MGRKTCQLFVTTNTREAKEISEGNILTNPLFCEVAEPQINFKESLRKTTVEYTQSGSLHGMQYIFESGKGLMGSRVAWTALVLAAGIMGVVWSAQVMS